MEKRKSPRRELVVDARLIVGEMVPTKVSTVEVGRYGMSMIGVKEPLTTGGQVVSVTFDMFDVGQLRHIAVSGRVSHCTKLPGNDYRVGLQFFSLDADISDVLSRYVGSA
jgi:hypothetical protein